jgi:hypothetical protein
MRHRNPFAAALLAAGLIAASGSASGQSQPFQPTYEEGIARRGQDYRSFQPTDPSALYCQQACLAEPQCRAWGYDGGKQPTCWLKSGVPAPVQARGIVSGVVRPDEAANAATPAKTNSPAAPAPTAAAAKAPSYRRTVQSGVDSPLAYERSWDANCQPLPLQVTITQQPANGSIWAIEGTSTIPASTPRGGNTGACAGKSVLGNEVFYRSNAGFHGEDSAAYELAYANGRRETISVVIEVKDASAAATAPAQGTPQGKMLSCTVPSGQEARCTSHARIDGQHHEWAVLVDVTTQPAHGKVITRIAEEPLKFRDGHSETAHATVIFYQSNPGYTGQDSFTYQRHTDDASDTSNGTYTMNVTVK